MVSKGYQLSFIQIMTIWRDIILHYADNPEKQKQIYLEFEREIRAVLLKKNEGCD